MNVLKTIRLPFFSMLLASLMLVISCSQYDSNIEDVNLYERSNQKQSKLSTPRNLSSYISKSIDIGQELQALLKNEQNINLSIESLIDEIETPEALENLLNTVGFEQFKEITSLITEFNENSIEFAKNNPYFENLDKEEVKRILADEVNNQFAKVDPWGEPCGDAFHAGHDVCLENLAISGGAVIISAFFTFGIGTFIGGGVAGIQFLRCWTAVNQAYYDCLEEQQGN